jgi:hypothetical protein
MNPRCALFVLSMHVTYYLLPLSCTQVSPVTGQTYMYVQHPVIQSLSVSRSGLLGGATLTITGTGFDPVSENNVVWTARDGKSACVVRSSTLTQITCVVGAGVPESAPLNSSNSLPVFPGGRGLFWEVRHDESYPRPHGKAALCTLYFSGSRIRCHRMRVPPSS